MPGEKIKVIAAIIDTRQLTLYKEDGTTIMIPQGDPRLRPIVDEVVPLIETYGYAMLELTGTNEYEIFEKKTKELIRFFMVAKNMLAQLFADPTPVESREVGTASLVQLATKTQRQAIVDQIMQHAVPAASPLFGTDKETTVVAIINEDTVIPDVQGLRNQIHRANETTSMGMDAFMTRISKVINHRQHSIKELMRFMERGDLPIADDGSIVIYKVLKTVKDGRWADCRTGQVFQRIGSYVCMDESIIDLNRREECATGLHVARRGYLGGFDGNICVIAKVAPEDVIVVPDYDANKMRVAGYHILFQLSTEAHRKLRANTPFTDTEDAQILLGRAIAGDHPPPVEEVRIGGPNGTMVEITQLGLSALAPDTKETKTVVKTEALPDNLPKAVQDAPVTVQEAMDAAKPKVPNVGISNRVTQARAMLANMLLALPGSPMRKSHAADLLTYKKKAKVGWDTLGITAEEAAEAKRSAQ